MMDTETEKLFVGGKWRTVEEIHAMACYSVIEDVRQSGPSTQAEIRRRQGLCEVSCARAVKTCLTEGTLGKDAGGRLYLKDASL